MIFKTNGIILFLCIVLGALLWYFQIPNAWFYAIFVFILFQLIWLHQSVRTIGYKTLHDSPYVQQYQILHYQSITDWETVSSIDIPKRIMSYREFLRYRIEKQDTIPFLIFRMSFSLFEDLPVSIKETLEKTQEVCKEYTQVYVSDIDIDMFIKRYYPQYMDLYHSVIPGAFRSDIARLLLIYHYGGIYNDIGHTYMVSPSQWIKDNLILVKDTYKMLSIPQLIGIYNAFIAASPHHPVIKEMIDTVMDNVEHQRHGISALDITGPKAISRAFNHFFQRPEHEVVEQGRYLWTGKDEKPYPIQVFYLKDSHIYHEHQALISCKFKNYQKTLYHHRPKYSELWWNDAVFN